MRWLALLLLWPQVIAAQSIPETVEAIISNLPPAAFEAPAEATTILIALRDPDFAETPSVTSPIATRASQLILPPAQTRLKFARTAGARYLIRNVQPAQIAGLYLTQSNYGRGCVSLAKASETLFGQPVTDADLRTLLTLVTLTQAPTYYANAPVRLTSAFQRNVETLLEMQAIAPADASRLIRFGPSPVPESASCSGA